MDSESFDNLDMQPEDFRKLGYRVIDVITEYYTSLHDVRVFPASTSSDIEQVFTEDLPGEGQDPFGIIEEWKSKILPYATHLGSPRYFGFVNGSGTMIGTLAEALAASVNMNTGGWKPAPSATEVERRTIKWLAEMVGYSNDCGGLFTSGGTMANFTAIETALRNLAPYDTTSKGLQDKPISGKFKVYMSDHEGHVSIIRAVDLLNLGRESVHLVKSREDFSMDTEDLEHSIEKDIENGDFPLCVVAQVGSINVGVIDPLEEIARICKERKIWFHADGACGAVGILLPKKRSQYKGIELADSITMDPHKWLYIPYDCGCVLIRDAEKMRKSFSLNAPYLRGTLPTEYTGLYYLDYGPEMSRGFRALKVWMSLKHLGTEGYRKLLSQNVGCVEYLDTLVRKDTDFETLHKPNLLMYCLRYAPTKIKAKYASDINELDKRLDALNQQIVDEIQLSGTAFLMTTKVLGRVVIRFSVCSHRTTQQDIDIVFLKLKEIGESLALQSDYS
jgi:aromatic-L-amino-acid decarboxylase